MQRKSNAGCPKKDPTSGAWPGTWLTVLVLSGLLLGYLAIDSPRSAYGGYCLAGACHADLVQKKYLHGPVTLEKQAQGGCALCHMSDGPSCSPSRGGKFAFTMGWDDLCLGCHGDTIQPDHKLPARPCVICHDPHGSNISKRLFRKGIRYKERANEN